MSRNGFIALAAIAFAAMLTWLVVSRQTAPEKAGETAGTQNSGAPSTETLSHAVEVASPTVGEVPTVDEIGARVAPDVKTNLDARTLTMCQREVRKRKGMAEFNCDDIDEKEVSVKNACLKQLEYVRRELQEASAKSASCPENIDLPSQYYSSLRDLAIRGDVDAQRCFIQGYFGVDRERGIDLEQAQLDEYPALAKRFIDAGFERGDWSIVRWLSKSRVDMADLLLARAHPLGFDDRVNAYRIRRLLMLGNQSALSELPDDQPKRLIEYWRQKNWLTPEQLKLAEDWAETMYSQHFIGSEEGASIGRAEFCGGK
jgi:hypothetical protein